MNPRASLAQSTLYVLGLIASLLAACGGRYQTVRDFDDDTVNGTAGRSGGGAPSTGAGGSAPSRAGSSSAGSGNAGSGGVGAGAAGSGAAGSGNACNNVKCPIFACPAGSQPLFASGACCATTCSSSCPPCAKIECSSGTHAENLSGNCCPTCVDDRAGQCTKGQQGYFAQRDALLKKYRSGCASSAECVVIAPLNRCEQGCSYTPVWYGSVDSLESNLSNSADAHCASCKLGPIPCPLPPSAVCINGSCEFLVK